VTSAGDATHPAISVIVPIFNVAEFLPQCVASLLAQTEPDLEILLIDDGSTDASARLVDAYAAQAANVRAFHKPNGGLSDARNFGLDRARGAYVGFVDGDDWVEPTMFAQLLHRARATAADVVVCAGVKHLSSDGSQVRIKIRAPLSVFGTSIRASPKILYASHSLACNKLFRRALFESRPHRFPVGRWFEDTATIYAVMADAQRIEAVDEALYHYRFEREGAITSSVDSRLFDIFRACDDFIDAYRSRGLLTPKVARQVERAVRNHIVVRFDVALSAKDRGFARAFMRRSFQYLNATFPGWTGRYPVAAERRFAWKYRARRSRWLAELYIATPSRLRRSLLSRLAARASSGARTRASARDTARDTARNTARYGVEALALALRLIEARGLVAFADFGTLLGLVRDGRLIPGDLDIDIGVLRPSATAGADLRAHLRNHGFVLWREYSLAGQVAEESYHLFVAKGARVKIDINYYDSDDAASWTHLFFRDPTETYLPRERSVVRVLGPRIQTTERFGEGPHDLRIPSNAEAILAAKYGPGWRVPDASWRYWQGPGSQVLPERVVYRDGRACPHLPDHALRRLQQAQTTILDEVERLCQHHGLRYYLSEGTLLGAVRHGGHIPWDDDIDVALPREDYERFVALAVDGGLTAGFRIWCSATDPRYHLPFAKVVKSHDPVFRNTFPPDADPSLAGPRLDLFPIDRVPFDRGPALQAHWREVSYWRRLLRLKRGLRGRRNGVRQWFSDLARWLPYAWLHARLRRAATRHNSNAYACYAINTGSAYSARKHTVPLAWYGEPEWLPFEGKLRPCPSGARALLERTYGDYLTLPPSENRVQLSHYLRYFPEPPAAT
jgi:phosphorylcholine metabolism protein LicD/glycosyltransferase involved in cell wall biosynthesis